MKNIFTILLIIASFNVWSQVDSSQKLLPDSGAALNQDATYQRPMNQLGKIPVAIGGYVEANVQYGVTDGVNEGWNFQFRRFTLFFSSTVGERLRFFSELEFEEGTEEINLEYAALDVVLHPLLNIRTGIILNPIGAFNQNHDGPKWEFIDRPMEAAQLLPATWSNAGAGLHGKLFGGKWIAGYEFYLTNGFNDHIIGNSENKTFLPAAKEVGDRFEESWNGSPMVTAKAALRRRNIAEVGFSYMGGVYNKWQEDGLIIDEKRNVHVLAADWNMTIPKLKTVVTGEYAFVKVEVPDTYTQQYGEEQSGVYVDIVQPVLKTKILSWPAATLLLAVRGEYVDWNMGILNETGGNIYDDVKAISGAISFRPVAQAVFRINYRYLWQRDLFGNPPARTGIFQVGMATYF